jgi:undecaprenyl phosphate N,N'-diacetylbacillosamine 1-phosphate transferase
VYERYLKRTADIVLSLLVILGLFPIWMCVALLVIIDSPGNPFFTQKRIGLGGREYVLLKFRSMVPNAASQGKGFFFDGEADPRITRVGRIIRKLSIDEVPQLVNVLKGDMSIIGPRPMLPYQYQYLSPEQRRRFSVRPGITGLAQVQGRNVVPWSERIVFDLVYVDGRSMRMDLSILLQTLVVCFQRKDIAYDLTPEQIEDFIPRGKQQTATGETRSRS